MKTSAAMCLSAAEGAAAVVAGWREAGLTTVWTNGCFDLLHAGHVDSLCRAAMYGDRLIVGLNTDQSVRGLKGGGRPLVSQYQRAAVLAAIRVVDAVLLFDEPDPCDAIARVRPDVVVKGDEYAPGGRPMPERAIVEGYGGRCVYLKHNIIMSTSELVKRAVEHGQEN